MDARVTQNYPEMHIEAQNLQLEVGGLKIEVLVFLVLADSKNIIIVCSRKISVFVINHKSCMIDDKYQNTSFTLVFF